MHLRIMEPGVHCAVKDSLLNGMVAHIIAKGRRQTGRLPVFKDLVRQLFVINNKGKIVLSNLVTTLQPS